MIVGLTGGIGSGKSTALGIFQELGVPTTSADRINKQILETDPTVYAKIIAKFEQAAIAPHNVIDRKKLRHKIFNSEQDRKWLEQLLHPLIKQKILEFSKSHDFPYCVIEIPLLLEAGMQDCVDRILIIDVPEELQVLRTSQRDQVPEAEVKKIMATQLSREQRLAQQLDLVVNLSDLTMLQQQIQDLHIKYLGLAGTKILK